jgi:hypothetical protein
MPTQQVFPIFLTPHGQGIYYDRRPCPRFRCDLSPDIVRQLRREPAVALTTPKSPKAFWLLTLLDSVRVGGQIVFESMLPPQHNDPTARQDAAIEENTPTEEQWPVVIRSLFQLGEVVVAIDEQLLKHADAGDILEAHRQWTGWCLTQLGQAVALPVLLRRLGWAGLFIGPSCFIGGVFFYGGILQPLGILLAMPGHLLLPPERRRYFTWFPATLGVLAGLLSGGIASAAGMQLGSIGMLALFQVGTWPSLGGRCVIWLAKWLAKQGSNRLIRWAIRQTFT